MIKKTKTLRLTFCHEDIMAKPVWDQERRLITYISYFLVPQTLGYAIAVLGFYFRDPAARTAPKNTMEFPSSLQEIIPFVFLVLTMYQMLVT